VVLTVATVWRVRSDGAAFAIALLLSCFWVANLYADWFLMSLIGLFAWAADTTKRAPDLVQL
jgi:hypothetical protein